MTSKFGSGDVIIEFLCQKSLQAKCGALSYSRKTVIIHQCTVDLIPRSQPKNKFPYPLTLSVYESSHPKNASFQESLQKPSSDLHQPPSQRLTLTFPHDGWPLEK